MSGRGAQRRPRPADVHDRALGSRGLDLVIEAIVEELEPKREVFAELERVVGAGRDPRLEHLGDSDPRDRRGARDPERVIGMHFFDPAPLLPLRRGDPRGAQLRRDAKPAYAWAEQAGKRPGARERHARVHSQPGRRPDVERVHPPAHEGVTPEDLDKAMTMGMGWPMGPARSSISSGSTFTSTPPRRCTRRPETSARSRRSACARWPPRAASAGRAAAASTSTRGTKLDGQGSASRAQTFSTRRCDRRVADRRREVEGAGGEDLRARRASRSRSSRRSSRAHQDGDRGQELGARR